jgi:hypothetical protein
MKTERDDLDPGIEAELVQLVDDEQADGPELLGYEEWRAEVKLHDDLDALLRWAVETLPAAVLPCRCLDASCLRCQVDRIVAERSDPPASGPDGQDDGGEPPF